MRSVFSKHLGAEAGLGLLGGAALFLLASPTGQRWLKQGSACAARGAATAGVAIGSLFADLRVGWQELMQEVKQVKSASDQGQTP